MGRAAAFPFVAIWLLRAPLDAHGQDIHERSEHLSDRRENARHDRDASFIVMPIPMSDPHLGTGLGVVAMALYHDREEGGPWTTGVGGFYTDTESWLAGVFHKANFDNDRYRLTAGAGYGVFNVDFFGIGADAGARDVSIGLEQDVGGLIVDALMRVRPHLYLGARYRGATVNTAIDTSELPFSDLLPPSFELESATSALGISAEYDTRDDKFAPARGLLFDGQLLYASEALGSDFDYGVAQLALNGYQPVGDITLAWRGSLCWSGDDAPFYDLCNYGSQNDLRGYSSGQYRDHAMFAVQAEARAHLFWKVGAAAFAGVGAVAPDFGSFDGDELLPAAGVGLRYQASERYRINLSIDYAVGEDSDAVYFRVGEAF